MTLPLFLSKGNILGLSSFFMNKDWGRGRRDVGVSPNDSSPN